MYWPQLSDSSDMSGKILLCVCVCMTHYFGGGDIDVSLFSEICTFFSEGFCGTWRVLLRGSIFFFSPKHPLLLLAVTEDIFLFGSAEHFIRTIIINFMVLLIKILICQIQIRCQMELISPYLRYREAPLSWKLIRVAFRCDVLFWNYSSCDVNFVMSSTVYTGAGWSSCTDQRTVQVANETTDDNTDVA